jgi:hypothetical protein
MRRVVTEHCHRAAVPAPESLKDLHGRGLARAVRAEQSEHLAPADIKVDAAQRVDLAVGLAQVLTVMATSLCMIQVWVSADLSASADSPHPLSSVRWK